MIAPLCSVGNGTWLQVTLAEANHLLLISERRFKGSPKNAQHNGEFGSRAGEGKSDEAKQSTIVGLWQSSHIAEPRTQNLLGIAEYQPKCSMVYYSSMTERFTCDSLDIYMWILGIHAMFKTLCFEPQWELSWSSFKVC